MVNRRTAIITYGYEFSTRKSSAFQPAFYSVLVVFFTENCENCRKLPSQGPSPAAAGCASWSAGPSDSCWPIWPRPPRRKQSVDDAEKTSCRRSGAFFAEPSRGFRGFLGEQGEHVSGNLREQWEQCGMFLLCLFFNPLRVIVHA